MRFFVISIRCSDVDQIRYHACRVLGRSRPNGLLAPRHRLPSENPRGSHDVTPACSRGSLLHNKTRGFSDPPNGRFVTLISNACYCMRPGLGVASQASRAKCSGLSARVSAALQVTPVPRSPAGAPPNPKANQACYAAACAESRCATHCACTSLSAALTHSASASMADSSSKFNQPPPQVHLKEWRCLGRCQATTPLRAAAPWAPVVLHPGGGRAQAQLRSLA